MRYFHFIDDKWEKIQILLLDTAATINGEKHCSQVFEEIASKIRICHEIA